MLKIIQIRFQVFEGQSDFINYLMFDLPLTSINFGMPVDNIGPDQDPGTGHIVYSSYPVGRVVQLKSSQLM
jgi:hypothetical protein